MLITDRYPGTQNPVSGHSICDVGHSAEAESEKPGLGLKPVSPREMGHQDGTEPVMQNAKNGSTLEVGDASPRCKPHHQHAGFDRSVHQ